MTDPRRNIFVLFIIVTITLSACDRSISGTALSDPASHILPNLDAFTPVEAEVFYQPQRGGPIFKFVAPTGLSYGLDLSGDVGQKIVVGWGSSAPGDSSSSRPTPGPSEQTHHLCQTRLGEHT